MVKNIVYDIQIISWNYNQMPSILGSLHFFHAFTVLLVSILHYYIKFRKRFEYGFEDIKLAYFFFLKLHFIKKIQINTF